MINKLIALIIISILVVFFPHYAETVMGWIIQSHRMIVEFLTSIFSDGQIGRIIQGFLGTIIMPIIIGIVIALLYWLIRRRFFPYFVFVVWTIWLLQLGALIVLHKV